MNFRTFRDRLVWVSILVRKRLDLCYVLVVQYGNKGFGYLDIRERHINLYLVLSSLNSEFQNISRSFGLGFNPGT